MAGMGVMFGGFVLFVPTTYFACHIYNVLFEFIKQLKPQEEEEESDQAEEPGKMKKSWKESAIEMRDEKINEDKKGK